MACAIACAFAVAWCLHHIASYSLSCKRVQGELNQYNQNSRADLSAKLPAKVPELAAARL